MGIGRRFKGRENTHNFVDINPVKQCKVTGVLLS